MDNAFITNIVDGYLIETSEYKLLNRKQLDNKKNEIIEEVTGILHYLRENDIETYNKIWDESRMTQQKILMSYLREDGGVISGLLALGSTMASNALVVIMAFMMVHGKTNKMGMTILNGTFKIIDEIATFIGEQSKLVKFSYSIINNNSERCYSNCRINKDTTTFLHNLYFMIGDISSSFIPDSYIEDCLCLRHCYFLFIIENIAITFKTYLICLKYQNKFSEIEKLDSNDLLKIIMGSNAESSCQQQFEYLNKLYFNFYKLMDLTLENTETDLNNKIENSHVFDKVKHNKSEYLQILKDKLIQSKNEIKNFKTDNTQTRINYFNKENKR